MAGLIARPLFRTSQHFTRRNISLTAIAGDALNGLGEPSTSEKERWDQWRRQKSRQLLSSLSDPATPASRVWSFYKDFFTLGEPGDLSLHTHQQVLRRCVAPTHAVRQGAAARMREAHGRDAKHLYETRLQRVISMIRAAGMQPTLADYNFVLEQFAAAGYQTGASKVFQEMIQAGLEPSGRSYGLVLQAVAHRLELPCAYRFREQVEREASQIVDMVLNDMDARGIAAQSVHVDLCLRITRTTGSKDSFLQLLRQAYGIDLENPDRHPLTAADTALPSLGDMEAAPAPELQPFSVHVLNTVVNFLGSKDSVSQMILAFEVLTNPLPTRRPSSSSFADDDDDAHAFYDLSDPSHSSPRPMPSAPPNTTTFIFLIKHLARLQKQSLIRHYLLEAIQQERAADKRLKDDLETKPLEEATVPKVHVRKSLLEPALGLGNRTRRIPFLMWLWRETKWLLVEKRVRMNYFSRLQSETAALEEVSATTIAELRETADVDEALSTALSHPTDSPATEASPPGGVEDVELWKPSSSVQHTVPFFSRAPPPQSIDLNLDAPSPRFTPRPTRPFLLPVHVALLQKDYKEIQDLLSRIRRAVWRLTARRKEWLGRRVWAGKSIYLTSEGERTVVSREKWVEIANFREPWKVGKKGSLVKLQEGGVLARVSDAKNSKTKFVLPPAVPHTGVEERFVDPAIKDHRPRVRWRRH
ncbi:hypothetical protein EXIGLDRAFT_715930 [Exidia glandulosa HHB12029]|uniref:Uncharacterized protein n=1 Tax=Exidia glandulosa HHB12029 TaxID=1314781 RepID=A0A165QPE1_EXIGL|nr:hypothetical protein EXIGLDRAFT_715930 [Exidia glandulosa HHB12029]